MDELDVRIIRLMGIRPYAARPKDPDALKPGHISKRLDVAVNTVKARIARMEETGVIAGYKLLPNLRHLGRRGAAYYFGSPPDQQKESVLAELKEVDGGLEVHDFLGGGFCVDFTYTDTDDLSATLGSLCELTNEDQPVKFYDRDMPPVERALTSLDWRILRALRADAMRPLDDVAAELGVTGRTVRSRYGRMASEGSFFAVPVVDPSKAEGLFLFEILVWVDDGAFRAAARRLLSDLDDHQVFAYVPASPEFGHLDMLLFARNTAQVEALRQRAAEVPGVARADAWLFRGFHDQSGWLDAAIDDRIEALAW